MSPPRLDFRWIGAPPVVDVTLDECRQLARRLLGRLEDYFDDTAPPVARTAVLEAARDQPRSFAADNVEMAQSVCGAIADLEAGPEAVLHNFVYKLATEPVAIMVFNLRAAKGGIVELLVVHPAAESGGSIMVELAINFLVRKGRAPYLVLEPMENAEAAYEGMGFKPLVPGGDLWCLDLTLPGPARSPKWIGRAGGGWRYVSARYPGPLYSMARLKAR